jgi:hypothetical protein
MSGEEGLLRNGVRPWNFNAAGVLHVHALFDEKFENQKSAVLKSSSPVTESNQIHSDS